LLSLIHAGYSKVLGLLLLLLLLLLLFVVTCATMKDP
jgi:hypothetical protein